MQKKKNFHIYQIIYDENVFHNSQGLKRKPNQSVENQSKHFKDCNRLVSMCLFANHKSIFMIVNIAKSF